MIDPGQPTPAQIKAAKNTDRELWREREGDYYADSIFVTDGGSIGMNVGGSVVVMPIRKWFALTAAAQVGEPQHTVLGQYLYDEDSKLVHINEIKARTIERCAQAAENFGKIIYPSTNAGEQFAAAIRKLKDAP